MGHQHDLPLFVQSALAQSVDAPRRVGCAANLLELEHLGPNAFALAFAQLRPHRAGISHSLCGHASAMGALRGIHLDDEGLSRDPGQWLGPSLLVESSASTDPSRRETAGATRSGDTPSARPASQVELGLARRVLHTGAQSQFEAVAQSAQIGGTRRVAVDALVGTPHVLFFGAGGDFYKFTKPRSG